MQLFDLIGFFAPGKHIYSVFFSDFIYLAASGLNCGMGIFVVELGLFSSCDEGSRAQAQYLPCLGLIALRHVGFSWTRD